MCNAFILSALLAISGEEILGMTNKASNANIPAYLNTLLIGGTCTGCGIWTRRYALSAKERIRHKLVKRVWGPDSVVDLVVVKVEDSWYQLLRKQVVRRIYYHSIKGPRKIRFQIVIRDFCPDSRFPKKSPDCYLSGSARLLQDSGDFLYKI